MPLNPLPLSLFFLAPLREALFRVFRDGMRFVYGAPWNTQDAVAERAEIRSP
jgi:hypothetical protein